MTQNEALKILQLNVDFSPELLRHNYHKRYVECFRGKSVALTNDEVDEKKGQIQLLNDAFCTLDNTEVLKEGEIQLDFRFRDFDKEEILKSQNEPNKSLRSFIERMMVENREGLALSLLEMSIALSARESSSLPQSNLKGLIPLLGKLLLELGLVEQGIKFLNFGKSSAEKAENHFGIGDYKMAAHHYAMELKLSESNMTVDDICQRIAICYFLLSDYENATNIVEEVLPKLAPTKQIFETSCKSNNFAIAMMISIYKQDDYKGKMVDAIKLRLKYPLCYKYLQNCFGKVETAWNVIKNFEEDNTAYEQFMNELKPPTFIRKEVNMDYDEEEISQIYLNLFEEPIQRSLIYHPKEKSH